MGDSDDDAARLATRVGALGVVRAAAVARAAARMKADFFMNMAVRVLSADYKDFWRARS